MVARARALEEITRRDRRWFRAHPERWHRCRWPHPEELDFCGGDFGSRLVIAIRHLGGGRIVYQPVIFEGTLPGGERAAAALFALALRDPEPIPVVAEMNVLRLQQSGAIAQRITAAGPSLPPVAAPAAPPAPWLKHSFLNESHHLSQVETHQTATWLRGVTQEVPAASVSARRQFAQCEGWGTEWRQ